MEQVHLNPNLVSEVQKNVGEKDESQNLPSSKCVSWKTLLLLFLQLFILRILPQHITMAIVGIPSDPSISLAFSQLSNFTTLSIFANSSSPRIPSAINHTLSLFSFMNPLKSCRTYMNRLNDLRPSEINALRRYMQKSDLECFEKMFLYFKNHTLSRVGLKHYNLHIPKTGGTSLCHFVKQNGLITPPGPHHRNCWHQALCPYWCCCKSKEARLLTCDEMENAEYDFVSNERWLDYFGETPFCDNMIYSVAIRDAVDRAMSHINNLMTQFKAGMNIERLSKSQNYMTWVFTAGKKEDPIYSTVSSKENLDDAKRILSGFDFILDLSLQKCDRKIFNLMSMGKPIRLHHYKAAKSKYGEHFIVEDVRMHNNFDIALVEYAKELIDLDCAFFDRIELRDIKEKSRSSSPNHHFPKK